ncbi:MAG TPA: succinyl-diaminopimelate desuccinylase [Stellaceae bacterium]|jgi:succinyl-diaminopimelate desuccinylase|nr:succinyl-diaminopimelate desuccinylase [Stellaceae bacterium]
MTVQAKPEAVDPAALAAELIRCPSVTPKDAGAIDVLVRALDRLGFACTKLEFTEPDTEPVLNLYARLGRSGRNFCFAGHTDVVPVGRRESWTVDPFGAEVIDGALYGRGAADMKGGIAAFVAAVARFLGTRAGVFDGSISLLITGDEEGVSINGTRKVLDWLQEQGERLDACVVGEPTSAKILGDMVKIGRRGSLTGTITVKGVQGHTAYPHLADNPVHRMVTMLHSLTAEPLDNGTEHFQPSTLQLTTTDVGNPASNVIPGEARAVFNIRFNDRWSSKTLQEWIESKLAAAGGNRELKVHVSGESFLTPPGSVSEILTRAIRQVTGRTPELSTTGGTSDARFIHRHCPVAEFGLVGLTMHKVDERVPVADLAVLADIYRAVLDLYFPAA